MLHVYKMLNFVYFNLKIIEDTYTFHVHCNTVFCAVMRRVYVGMFSVQNANYSSFVEGRGGRGEQMDPS